MVNAEAFNLSNTNSVFTWFHYCFTSWCGQSSYAYNDKQEKAKRAIWQKDYLAKNAKWLVSSNIDFPPNFNLSTCLKIEMT